MDRQTGLPIVGMVGGGQLARMTHQAAMALGLSLCVLSERSDDSAARATGRVVVGTPQSPDDLMRFGAMCDVVTFDHEWAPTEHLCAMAAAGINLQPSPEALRYAQDKRLMRQHLTDLGLPCPRWVPISSDEELSRFGAEVGWPVVLKAAKGGYDGRGVWVVKSAADASAVLTSGIPLIAEEKVAIKRELAALVARSSSGECTGWPTVETIQEAGICVEVIAPAPCAGDHVGEAAAALGIRIAELLGVTGVLAVEMFETPDGQLVVNELAMRPHNSGHWTIEGARTSQFEQHLRAVLDYPLGAADMAAEHVVMANVLGAADPDGSPAERLRRTLGAFPDVKVHLYGKEHRPGRKLGHVTALGEDLAEVRHRARAAAQLLAQGRPA